MMNFSSIEHCNSVFLNKKNLKGTKQVLTEDLQIARQKLGNENVWSQDRKNIHSEEYTLSQTGKNVL